MNESMTVARQQILWRYFVAETCPVCRQRKAKRNCFCRSCYFAVKAGSPEIAAGLWTSALDHRQEFFEKYAECADWLRARGLGDPDIWNTPAMLWGEIT